MFFGTHKYLSCAPHRPFHSCSISIGKKKICSSLISTEASYILAHNAPVSTFWASAKRPLLAHSQLLCETLKKMKANLYRKFSVKPLVCRGSWGKLKLACQYGKAALMVSNGGRLIEHRCCERRRHIAAQQSTSYYYTVNRAADEIVYCCYSCRPRGAVANDGTAPMIHRTPASVECRLH